MGFGGGSGPTIPTGMPTTGGGGPGMPGGMPSPWWPSQPTTPPPGDPSGGQPWQTTPPWMTPPGAPTDVPPGGGGQMPADGGQVDFSSFDLPMWGGPFSAPLIGSQMDALKGFSNFNQQSPLAQTMQGLFNQKNNINAPNGSQWAGNIQDFVMVDFRMVTICRVSVRSCSRI